MSTKIKLSNEMLATLITGALVLEKDSFGPKVYKLANGNFLKLFRRKRLVSSALLVPYSERFWRNADKLKALNIPTLTPLSIYRLEDPAVTAVCYRPLAGRTLKDIYLEQPSTFGSYMPELIKLIRTLHRSGVYFRSLHLGNIVLTPGGKMGLIDIADLSIQRRALSTAKAKRNLAHFSRLLKTMGIAEQFPMEALSSAVLDN
ncbi:toluene tolerance protein [Pseudomonas sp. SH1-B]